MSKDLGLCWQTGCYQKATVDGRSVGHGVYCSDHSPTLEAVRYLVVKLVIKNKGGVQVEEVVDNCDYNFISQTPQAEIIETEIIATLTQCPAEV